MEFKKKNDITIYELMYEFGTHIRQINTVNRDNQPSINNSK